MFDRDEVSINEEASRVMCWRLCGLGRGSPRSRGAPGAWVSLCTNMAGSDNSAKA